MNSKNVKLQRVHSVWTRSIYGVTASFLLTPLCVTYASSSLNSLPIGLDSEQISSLTQKPLSSSTFSPQKHSFKKQILFIDSTVKDPQVLTKGLSPEIEVITIQADRDGLQQMAEALKNRSGIETLHIVSHGEPGRLLLGNSKVDQASLNNAQTELQRIA